jgi:hypothetical protein
MRRLLVLALSLAFGAVVCAQETKVSKHPYDTLGGASAYRYDYNVITAPPHTGDSAIPLSETRRMLCDIKESPLMSKRVEEWVNLALSGVQDLNKEDVFVTYLEICRESGGPPHFGHLHGNEMQFASGIVKPLYATALLYSLQENNLPVNPALQQDLIAMLHHLDNGATNKLVDYMTGTKSGPQLGYPEFCDWALKRDYANWFYVNVGFQNFNLNQKIWTGPPPPRDLQLLDEKLPLNYANSNRMTTNQAAALMYLINVEAIVSRCASQMLKSYMYRPLEQEKLVPLPGIAAGLPIGAELISMKGYTERNYHDVAIVTLPNHQQYVLAVFTKYNRYPTYFIPLLSKIVAHRHMQKTGDDEPSDFLYARPLAGELSR